MEAGTNKYDVAIIGSGIAGSALGAILARHGFKVVIFEAGSHPKFAVGESMILETSETLRAMAELFDVPELAYFSSEHYFGHIGTSHGVKRHFSFLHHASGQTHDLSKTLQAVIPRQPHGHELHLFRQDSDSYLAAAAVSYGAELLQNTPVKQVDIGADWATCRRNDLILYAGDQRGYYALQTVQDCVSLSHTLWCHSESCRSVCAGDVAPAPSRVGSLSALRHHDTLAPRTWNSF